MLRKPRGQKQHALMRERDLAVEAINSNDIPIIKATVMVGSIIYVFASLLTDICYAWVDPRIKLR